MFSSLLAAFDMKYSLARSVAVAVVCVVRLFNLINTRCAGYGLAEPRCVTMILF